MKKGDRFLLRLTGGVPIVVSPWQKKMLIQKFHREPSMTDSFDDQTLREQAQEVLRYIESDPDQTLVPDGRVRLLRETLAGPDGGEMPLLGLATTAQLLEELTVRAEIHGYAKYRTVGGEEIMSEAPTTQS